MSDKGRVDMGAQVEKVMVTYDDDDDEHSRRPQLDRESSFFLWCLVVFVVAFFMGSVTSSGC